MCAWKFELGETILQEPPNDAESFAAMEEESQTAPSLSLSDPILPCQKSFVELCLAFSSGEPAAGAKFKLDAPGAPPQSGTLDEKGRVRIEDINIDPQKVMLKVHVTEEEDSEEDPVYQLQLVAKEEPKAQEEEPPQEEEPAHYFFPDIVLEELS